MNQVSPDVNTQEARSAMLLAQLSHEIRAPLTGIRWLMQSIAAGHMPSKLFDEVEQSVQYLLNLSESYLHRVRAETPSEAAPQEDFDLATVVQEAIDLVKHKADEKQLGLIVDGLSVNLQVHGDPLQIKQILVNLLSNGIKYTEKGHVRVAACVAPASGGGSMLTLIVSDTGRGMSGPKSAHAFKPFVRLHPNDLQSPGYGLGLAIVKELAEASGGDVMAIDSPEGGLQVLVSVKMAHAPAPVHSLQATSDQAPARLSTWPGDIRLPDRCVLPERHRGKCLLLVDDSMVNQIIVGEYLRAIGFEVHMAAHGADALEAMEREAVDLVLTDLTMPVLDGHGLLQEIRRRGMDMPVVALTGEARPETRSSCRQSGMAACLTKPLDHPQALNDLVEALDNHAALRINHQERGSGSDKPKGGAPTRP
jgi:CheY-like chemotaxis protein